MTNLELDGLRTFRIHALDEYYDGTSIWTTKVSITHPKIYRYSWRRQPYTTRKESRIAP
jgi:hypothetical protein